VETIKNIKEMFSSAGWPFSINLGTNLSCVKVILNDITSIKGEIITKIGWEHLYNH
jgi:hypothetical protein